MWVKGGTNSVMTGKSGGLVMGRRNSGGMLLDPMWRLLVWVKGGTNSVMTGKSGSSFVVRVERKYQRPDKGMSPQPTISPSPVASIVPVDEAFEDKETKLDMNVSDV